MKKSLFFVALAISMNVSAQNLPFTSGIPRPISNLKENHHTRTGDEAVNIFESIHHPISEQLNALQQNDSIYTWQWSGIQEWTFYSKFFNMEYDSKNNLTFYKIQSLTWNAQHTLTYDLKNNLINELNEFWGFFVPGKRQYTYTYDDNQNLTGALFQDWNGSDWVNLSQGIYAYDVRKNRISEVHQVWGGIEFINYNKKTYSFDLNNNKTSEVDYDWNGSAWVPAYQYFHTYTYDNKKNKISEVVKFVDTSGIFSFINKYTFTYDSSNNKISEVGQDFNNGWSNSYKYTLSYDNRNNLISQFTAGWLGNVWVNYLQDIYAYNNDNYLTSHQNLKLDGSTWKPVEQWINTYDAQNFKTSESHKEFDTNTGTIVTSGDSAQYYFHTVTAVEDAKPDDSNFSIYPNPSSGKFTISCNSTICSIEIYNLLGEQVYSDSKFNHDASNDIDLSMYGKGIYFINIFDKQIRYTRKVVVQ